MRTSKFVRIDKNILLEYIYDDGNLISEPYSIVYNTNTSVNSFLSSLSETKNYIYQKTVIEDNKSVTKSITNQLVKLDAVQGQYGRLDMDKYSFIQKKDYGISIPIRYDKIRLHLPTNYVFDGFKGCHLRVFTLDFNNQKFVDLSNYFFNVSDTEQIVNLEYSNPPLMQQETSWGKYLEIQFPSPTKVSDQRVQNITRENTINYNLTNGIGLSKNAPIFIDFFFINNVHNANNSTFFSLVEKKSISFPQTPEFEKFGVIIEKSSQGDFFLIYPTFNGSVGEFNQFIEESIILGNRYYVDYQIDIFEKNIKTSTQRIITTENFIDEIEFRPIFKYSTTTSIIDVTCKLIDAVDGSEIIRKSSYAMLQDEVSNYSRYLTKIDLTKAKKINVFKLKGISTPNLDINNNNSVNSSLKVNKIPFVIYSRNLDVVLDGINANYLNKTWLSNRQLTFYLFPFSNLLKFNLLSLDPIAQYKMKDLRSYITISLVFRSDKKNISIDIFKDSDQNNLEFGSIVFKINEDKYLDLKKMHQNGFNTFYLIGDLNGTKEIIYTGFFIPWDYVQNITKLESNFKNNKNLLSTKKKKINSEVESQKIEEVKSLMSNNLNSPTSINTTELNNVQAKSVDINGTDTLKDIESSIYVSWKPYWKSNQTKDSFNMMLLSYDYQFGDNLTNGNNNYQVPKDMRSFSITLKNYGFISEIEVDKNTGKLTTTAQSEIDIILGYFKIYNFNPEDLDILQVVSNNRLDIDSYIGSSLAKPQSVIKQKSNVPINKDVFELIQKYLIVQTQIEINPKSN